MTLEDGATKVHLLRVDHPLAGGFRDGIGTIGWEGDSRLCLYLDGATNQWVLMRLEHDNVYRAAMWSSPNATLNPDFVTQACQHLMGIDRLRGADPKASADTHNQTLHAAKAAARHDRIENDLADRLGHALRKDGLR
ncbi:MAG: hypothetical protein ACRD6B_03900 [Bryobacteraceae bacterium]